MTDDRIKRAEEKRQKTAEMIKKYLEHCFKSSPNDGLQLQAHMGVVKAINLMVFRL